MIEFEKKKTTASLHFWLTQTPIQKDKEGLPEINILFELVNTLLPVFCL